MWLQAAKVPLNEYEFPTSKLANVQSQLEKLVEKNYYLHQSAKDAYRAYLLSYNSHQLKSIFNVHTLDLKAVGKSFGFTAPPGVRHPKRSMLVSAKILPAGICDVAMFVTSNTQISSTCNAGSSTPMRYIKCCNRH